MTCVGQGLEPSSLQRYKNQEPVAFTAILFSSSLTQFTNNPTLPTPPHVFKSRSFEAHSSKSVDPQHLQTGKLACIIPFGASKNMSGNAGAGQQSSCLNAGASMSGNSSVTSPNSLNLQGISQNISLGFAGPISLVLSTPTSAPSTVSNNTSSTAQSGLTVPTTPQAPALKGMTKTTPVPHLSLDQETSTSSTTSQVTASPYTLNETTTFPKGTALWQSPSGKASITASTPSSIITASPYTTNETTAFAKGTPLWQSASVKQTQTQTPPQTPTKSSTSLITSSPYATNETTTFPKGTSLWQSKPTQASAQTPKQSGTSLITSSPYAQNESVTFPAGTALWQSSTTPTAASASITPRALACRVASSASSSQRSMGAPLPASNIIAASPYAQNESTTFSSQTQIWSSTNISASATNQTSSSDKPSLIASSPYTQNEGVTFPPGTPMWQSKK